MENLNPILNALVEDLVRQLTPVVVQAIAGDLENYRLQTDQKITDALDVSRNWVRDNVFDVLDQDLRGRVEYIFATMNDEHISNVDAMADRVIDKVYEEIDIEDKIKDYFDNNSFSINPS